MYRETCYFSQDYESDLRMLADPSRLVEIDTVMQFPFVAPVVEEKTEEELLRAAEKKKENGRRLQEMQQKQRLEKVRDQTLVELDRPVHSRLYCHQSYLPGRNASL